MKLPLKFEVRKPSKTLAGVTPIAVMSYPKKCKHGTCLYCPSLNVPQSYTPLSPPVMRASRLEYDARKQVESRLKAFKLMNHPTNKIELIIMGGTFLSYPQDYQSRFVKLCYDALNQRKSSSLEQAKKLNEKASHRLVALCIETRPDYCSPSQIKLMLSYGCTRVELGVQAIDDKIYKKVNRGHTIADVIQATRRLKDAGFKVGYHIMPGIPFSNKIKDLQMFSKLFKSEDFKPDQLKIYPCQVIRGSRLEKLYEQGKYYPYPEKDILELIIKMYKIVPEYCRIMRIMREISPNYLIAGTTHIDLRKDIEIELKKRNLKIAEIRFREIGFNIRDKKINEKINRRLKLKTIKYSASKGTEYFLQFINPDNILFALLRLRINKDNSAFIRELHVYGQALAVGKKPGKQDIQHKGLGKRLMQEAESICKNNKINKLSVISGVGVREYYRKLGYNLEKEYMVKKI